MTWLCRTSKESTKSRPRKSRLASATAFAALAALAATSALTASSANPLDIANTPFGTSLADWKATPFPGPVTGKVEPVCSDRPGIATDLLSKAASAPAGAVVCGYFGRYGRYLVPETLSALPKLAVTRARYLFVAGRLKGVEYRFSVNGYDDLMARLNKLYGSPFSVVRDTITTEAGAYPRVRQTWTTSSGQVELTDPSFPLNELSVRLTGKTDRVRGRPS